jgi:hypothetical protein
MEGIGCNCCGGTAPISGQVRGCLGTGIPGVVTVVSGATGGPFTTDGSGNYSGTLTITSPTATVVLSAQAATPNDVRFTPHQVTRSVTVGVAATQNFQPTAATGYHCLPSALGCNYPVLNTLSGTDPTFGAFSLAYNINGGNLWSVALNPAYTGVGACANQPSIAFGHDIAADGTWGTQWEIIAFGNDCPKNSANNAWTSVGPLKALEFNPITVVACLPLSLSITINLAVGKRLRNVYGTGPITITVTE